MGCATSKLDDLPAVALCKDRCVLLDEAIRQRYTLAQAHIAYLHSLKGMSQSLTEFFQLTESNPGFVDSPPSSPPERKSDPKQAIHHHSNSESHLDLHSDEDSGSGSGQSSPLHDHIEYMDMDNEHFDHKGGFLYMNYMKKSEVNVSSVVIEQKPLSTERIIHIHEPEMVKNENLYMNYMRKSNMAIPSVSYEQKPVINERVFHMSESGFGNSYFSYFSDKMGSQVNNNIERYPFHGFNDHDGGGGDYGVVSNYGYSSSWQPQREVAELSSSKQPPPPPPPPPENSGWGFLNIFESYDKYYQPQTPSRDSREEREEEGIPDLEDELSSRLHEVVKEVDGQGDHGDDHDRHEFADSRNNSKSSPEERNMVGGESSVSQRRPSAAVDGDGVEYNVHVVDKKVVDSEGRRSAGHGSNTGGHKSVRSCFNVLREIEMQFERASESGEEIARMLEVGKLPYHRKHQVTSKMVHVATPPLSAASSNASTSRDSQVASSPGRSKPASLGFDEEIGMSTGNLSSTLQKLYLWEKKLYNEVKSEEKMRVVHDRKVQKLKRLDEKGAEAQKVDSTRTLIQNLSTKIRITIQIVDKISVTINKIRDEELWPQLNELIQGLLRMWKVMLECHRNQCQAIKEIKNLSLIASSKKLSDSHLDTTLQFERELINWTFRFHSWVCAQKAYVRALNNWLLKCLLYEPEETADGILPFSPGRIGAPPIFVICNQWSQSMDRISEKEVLDSMRAFVMGVNQLWEQDKLQMHQRMLLNKDLERKVRDLDREDQKIQKEVRALDKKMIPGSGVHDDFLVTGELIYQGDVGSKDLQASLQHVLKTMERFADVTTKEYEDLLQRCEEESLAQRT